MKNWRTMAVHPQDSIQDTLKVIDKSGQKIALIVDTEEHLLGVLTDGDFRRAILKGISLQDPVEKIMNKTPITVHKKQMKNWREVLGPKTITGGIPVLNDQRQVVDFVKYETDNLNAERKPNWILLMAGGQGRRLMPLTLDCPKPLLQVGERPILETTMLSLRNSGFTNFYFSTHYRADMIKAHFEDGAKWNVNIQYLHEETPMGTVGCLSLLPEEPKYPIIVMNGDLLTNLDFDKLLKRHHETNASVTVCVRSYQTQVPFGVVTTSDESIEEIIEKPVQNYLVNAGVYVLSPEAIQMAKTNSYNDMVHLLNELIRSKIKVSAFPITEYWIDIGQTPDLEKAKEEFNQHFSHVKH